MTGHYYKGGYIQHQLRLAQVFNHPFHAPNAQNAKEWRERIENELSPENLCCDGELPHNVVMKKRRDLQTALEYINTLDGYVDVGRQQALNAWEVQKKERLQKAVGDGKQVGVRVRLTNGVVGVITKVNRTRFKVKGDDGREWGVPPTCCEVLA